ncbi:MAG: SH3 domain-containing protein, partial [Anaerolinea sp.]|nr:SH3 domain-containing protein [Anaerolinea sp.]
LNLRSAPDTAASLLGQTTANEVWRVLSRLADGSWWQVCCIDRQRAWVSGQWVQPIGPAAALERVPLVDSATSSDWRGVTVE